MTSFEEIKGPLNKVLQVIHGDRSKIARFTGGERVITAKTLDQSTGNHMCDDHPGWFGITKQEGHMIREYFQGDGLNSELGEFILKLHEEFPDMMDQEDSRYIGAVNKQRIQKGYSAIEL